MGSFVAYRKDIQGSDRRAWMACGSCREPHGGRMPFSGPKNGSAAFVGKQRAALPRAIRRGGKNKHPRILSMIGACFVFYFRALIHEQYGGSARTIALAFLH